MKTEEGDKRKRAARLNMRVCNGNLFSLLPIKKHERVDLLFTLSSLQQPIVFFAFDFKMPFKSKRSIANQNSNVTTGLFVKKSMSEQKENEPKLQMSI